MIYLELFLGFLKVGCFAFGGAYGAIPLIQEVVLGYGWLTQEELAYMIAVSESTPGPIMVNLATYVGSAQAGLPGSILATLAVILPSFLIILLITALLKTVLKNAFVQAALSGLKPCMIGIILATGASMLLTRCAKGRTLDKKAALIAFLLAGGLFVCRRFLKKNLSPIQLILISAALGVALYGF